MKSNHKVTTLISCIVLLSLAVAQASSDRTRLGDTRSVALPPFAILDDDAQPAIAASGKVGFVSSVTAGSLIAFSVSTGRLLSSIVVGENAGPVSLIEASGRRLAAVPAGNNPSEGHPATITVVDVTSTQSLEIKSLLVLPVEARITQTTRALLTEDGKFCLIATSIGEPALFVFEVESGELLSRMSLLERSGEVALHEDGDNRLVAVVSALANTLSVISLEGRGSLNLVSMFSPGDGRFSEANNPAFSSDGRSIYIAASEGDRLYAIDSRSGAQFGSIAVTSPYRVNVSRTADGADLIGVTRIRRPANGRPGGATVVSYRGGRLTMKAEFTPPDDIEFSKANNLVFDRSGDVAFIGSDSGVLFAFNTGTGELESHQQIGKGLHRIALSEKSRRIAAVRSSSTGDEIVIISFDMVRGESDSSAPRIIGLKPDTVEQGRAKALNVVVLGENFRDDSTLLVNGNVANAGLVKDGRGIGAKLRQSLFTQAGEISIQVRQADGSVSEPVFLHVRRPTDPTVERISPEEVPGPANAFTLKVSGANFRESSTISLGGQALDTEFRSDSELRAQVPAALVSSVGRVKVRVNDLSVPDLASNERDLNVFGPRITAIDPVADEVVAGDGAFRLRISGENFRSGAAVEINGNIVAPRRIRRNGSRSLRVDVPAKFAEEAGKLAIVVRNPEGTASEAKEIEALPPAITAFEQGQLDAGQRDVKVGIQGTNFRKGAQVFVANPQTRAAFRVERKHVRFSSSNRIVVTLKDKLNELVAQEGTVKFQVVNPNSGEGVHSADKELRVVGPEITEAIVKLVENDARNSRIRISGANFRKGAVVEFFKDGDVFVRHQIPDQAKADSIALIVRSKKVAGLLNLQVRVVNPGNVKSNAVAPRFEGESSS